MILHPLLLAIVTLDALALMFALYAGWIYLGTLVDWAPQSASPRQIALEAANETASLATRYCVVLFLLSTLLWLTAISLVLPSLVAGAMCGTGVMTAMRGFGERALFLRALAVSLLWVWRTTDAINRGHPRQPDVPLVARLQLLALPIVILAALYTARAFWRLDPRQAVECCQAVYSTFGSVKEATITLGLRDSAWLGLTSGLALVVVALAVRALYRVAAQRSFVPTGGLLLALLAFVPTATITLVRVLSAYHYHVLHHHCPWCLLLPEHHAVGYALYGALLVCWLEGIAAFVCGRPSHSAATSGGARAARQKRALLAVLVGLLIFGALTVGPMIYWRLSRGVWLHG